MNANTDSPNHDKTSKKKLKLKKKEKSKSGSGGAATSAAGNANEEAKHYKIEIRKLPSSDYNEKNFHDNIVTVLNELNIPREEVLILHFMEGKISRKRGPITGAGFISFKDENFLITFLRDCPTKVKFLEGESFEAQPVIIPAPYQKKFKSRERVDRLVNTLESDSDFLSFCDSLNAVIEPLPSAELQLDSKDKTLQKSASGGGNKNNPLLMFLKEKSDLKFAEKKAAQERAKGNKNKQEKKKGKKEKEKEKEKEREKERDKEKEKEPPKVLLKKREDSSSATSGGITILLKNPSHSSSSPSAALTPTPPLKSTDVSNEPSPSGPPIASQNSTTVRLEKGNERNEKHDKRQGQGPHEKEKKGKSKEKHLANKEHAEEVKLVKSQESVGVMPAAGSGENKERVSDTARENLEVKEERGGGSKRGGRAERRSGRGRGERKELGAANLENPEKSGAINAETTGVAMKATEDTHETTKHETRGGGRGRGERERGGGGRSERGGRTARGRGKKDSERNLEQVDVRDISNPSPSDSNPHHSSLPVPPSHLDSPSSSSPSLSLSSASTTRGRSGRTTSRGRVGGRTRGGNGTGGGVGNFNPSSSLRVESRYLQNTLNPTNEVVYDHQDDYSGGVGGGGGYHHYDDHYGHYDESIMQQPSSSYSASGYQSHPHYSSHHSGYGYEENSYEDTSVGYDPTTSSYYPSSTSEEYQIGYTSLSPQSHHQQHQQTHHLQQGSRRVGYPSSSSSSSYPY